MRVYAINRPFDLYTYPKQYDYTERVDFKCRQYVDEIGREAWGYIDYAEDVPAEELERYELVTAEMCARPVLPPSHVMRKMALALAEGDGETVEAMFEKLEARGFDTEAVDIELGRLVSNVRVPGMTP